MSETQQLVVWGNVVALFHVKNRVCYRGVCTNVCILIVV